MHRFTRVVLIVAGGFNVFAGAWAFFAPASFFDQLATFPPYNEHFLHDIGAFQIGLGVTLLAALRFSDAVFVVLVGVGTASVFHLAAHAMDTHLGGNPMTDLPGLGLFAAAIVVAAVQRWSQMRKGEVAGWHASKDDRAKVS